MSTGLAAGTAEAGAPSAARRRRVQAIPYLFVGPAFLMLMVFGVLPIVVAAVVSTTNLDISGLGNPANVRFIGLDNYARLLADDSFRRAVVNTAIFVAIGVPAIVVISLWIAIGLNQSQTRWFRFLRTFYFLPAITAIVAISLIWGNLYNSQFGLLNYVLSVIGIPPVGWLTDPLVAKLSVAVVGIWRATGFNIVIFLAALQAIPREYYEAAAIDGAGEWRKVVSITIPLVRFAIFFVTVTTLINWMQFFDEPYVLTDGGPIAATTSVSLYIFKEGFRFNQFGFASAASLVLFVVIVTVTALQLRLRESTDA